MERSVFHMNVYSARRQSDDAEFYLCQGRQQERSLRRHDVQRAPAAPPALPQRRHSAPCSSGCDPRQPDCRDNALQSDTEHFYPYA